MALSTAGLNLMLDALAASAGYVSLHTADPGDAGSNEVTGGAPAYARKAITWNVAAAKNLDSSNQPIFDVPSGVTITHFGVWSAVTAGTYYGGNTLPASEAYGAQGTYTMTDADILGS